MIPLPEINGADKSLLEIQYALDLETIKIGMDEVAIEAEFERLPKYEGDLPNEVWQIFSDAVKNNDRYGIAHFMRCSVDITHRECLKALLANQSKILRMERE